MALWVPCSFETVCQYASQARHSRNVLCCREMQNRRVGKTDPVLLEAVLGAKEAVLEPELQTCWALQGASIVLAVDAEALSLGGRFFGHSGGSVVS